MPQFLVFLTLLASLVTPHAQEPLDWCEVEAPPPPDPYPFGETPPLPDALAAQLEIPADYALTTTGFHPDVILSTDETRLITGVGNWQTGDFTLIAYNIDTDTIYARIDQERLIELRPTATLDIDIERDGIYFRRVQWIADSNRIAFQTGDYYVNSGEWAPPIDNLHIIDPDGTVRTLFEPEYGGTVAFSPDGTWVASANFDGLTLARVDGSDRLNNVLGDDYFAQYINGGVMIPKLRWHDDGEFLRVFVAPDTIEDRDDFWDKAYTFEWHVYMDGRSPELIRQLNGTFISLQFPPDNNRLLSYTEVTGNYEDGYTYTDIIEDLDTNIQYRLSPRDNSIYGNQWVTWADEPTVRVLYDDYNSFLQICD